MVTIEIEGFDDVPVDEMLEMYANGQCIRIIVYWHLSKNARTIEL